MFYCFLLSLMWNSVVNNSLLIFFAKCCDCFSWEEDGPYETWNWSKLQAGVRAPKGQVQCFQPDCCFEFGLDCKSVQGLGATPFLSPPVCLCSSGCCRCPRTGGASFSTTAVVLVTKAVISPPIVQQWRDYMSIFKMLTGNLFTAPSNHHSLFTRRTTCNSISHSVFGKWMKII